MNNNNNFFIKIRILKNQKITLKITLKMQIKKKNNNKKKSLFLKKKEKNRAKCK